MRHITIICALILASSPVANATNLLVKEGRPIVDGVYVNGHGPYRFLVDTGTNVNLIDTNLARSIGLTPTFQVDLASASGKTPVQGSDGNVVALDSAKAERQKFLYSGLDAIHNFSPDIRGVLGQWFLAQFDYTIDLRRKAIEFGKQEKSGPRVRFKVINGRLVLSTSLGELVLDSGSAQLALFGVEPDLAPADGRQMQTVTGSQKIGIAFGKQLIIDGRKIWRGDAIAFPNRTEADVDGLLPLSLLGSIYVCKTDGYVIFE